MHTYSCIHNHVCMHAYNHTRIHTVMHAFTHAHINTCTHTSIHTSIHTCTHTYIHTYIHMMQAHRCLHVEALVKWELLQSQGNISKGYGPVPIQPVNAGDSPAVFHVSGYESTESKLSFISKSPGRGSAHVFFVNDAHRCFVKAYSSKGKWFLTCHSSNGAHRGCTGACCKTVYEVIIKTPGLAALFPNLQDPSKHVTSRQPVQGKIIVPDVHHWPAAITPLIDVGAWSRSHSCGHYYIPPVIDPSIGRAYILPPCPEGFVRDLRGPCTLVGEHFTEEVLLFDCVNPGTKERLTVGPQQGIFKASSPECTRIIAYDAKCMYAVIDTVISSQSTLQAQYELLEAKHKRGLQAQEEGGLQVDYIPIPCDLPTYAQFCDHWHRFICLSVSLMRMAVIDSTNAPEVLFVYEAKVCQHTSAQCTCLRKCSV